MSVHSFGRKSVVPRTENCCEGKKEKEEKKQEELITFKYLFSSIRTLYTTLVLPRLLFGVVNHTLMEGSEGMKDLIRV